MDWGRYRATNGNSHFLIQSDANIAENDLCSFSHARGQQNYQL